MWSIHQAHQIPIATIHTNLLKNKKKSHYIFGIFAENIQEAAIVVAILVTAYVKHRTPVKCGKSNTSLKTKISALELRNYKHYPTIIQ